MGPRRSGDGDAAPGGADQPRGESYAAFWPVYLGAHRRPGTRALHFLGTALGLALLAAAPLTGTWWLLAAVLPVGYGLAWLGHAAIERNRPATFGHPLWSLLSDLRMFALWLRGRLATELRRHGLG